MSPKRYLEEEHEVDEVVLSKVSAVQKVCELVKTGKYDVFFVMVDASWEEQRPGWEVLDALERLNVPFTGTDFKGYDYSKRLAKMLAIYYGVKTAPYVFAYHIDDIEIAVKELSFPVIVKHHQGYSSVGMSKSSKCNTPEDLRREAGRIIHDFGGACIEEFITGREFTVLITANPDDPQNPITYPSLECRFPEGEDFKHFDLKWKAYEDLGWISVEDQDLDRRLRQATVTMYKAMKAMSYRRVDYRVDETGEIFFLEMNDNCAVFYPPGAFGSADEILAKVPNGHKEFAMMVIRDAFETHKKRQRKYTVRYQKRRNGFGSYANRAFSAGEVAWAGEEKAHFLVSERHVQQHWDATHRQWFRDQCFPINEEAGVFEMWNEDIDKWMPLRHSCDPNCCYRGLDIILKRDVGKGEELTIDYATFATTSLADFDCSCGAQSCRKRVRPTDYLQPWIEPTQQSPVVRARRRKILNFIRDTPAIKSLLAETMYEDILQPNTTLSPRKPGDQLFQAQMA
eukprot:TRINITY_DN4933_c0_g1_i1.p1 TRINITY_DN4933_c0_g1~~TRINITY_DN4933_c0_g1_i1.p1  ORF type:complete len:542 (-),score=86.27 TRINITY_DN4933_c0_g1_i1:1030-2565(-)